ncbi:est1 DNA/RNA binding domain-containing protein [Sarocladium implicatum]|nr:est1 DNA/RNA binding domain-containing protein [Sarocladium implicatum]
MALLHEPVQAFDETWVECLGDLSRYRIAIKDEDTNNQEIWTSFSRHWYTKASEKLPFPGRLYHHLAILARPNALNQLFCYTNLLCTRNSFPAAGESILTLFDPVLERAGGESLQVDSAFIKVHGLLFTRKVTEKELSTLRSEFLGDLDGYIGRTGRRWLESGYFTGIRLACSLLGYGKESNVLMRATSQPPKYKDSALTEESLADDRLKAALSFAVETWSNVMRRWGDINTLMLRQMTLVFLLHIARFPRAMVRIEKKVPWKLISTMLNYLLDTTDHDSHLKSRGSKDAYATPNDDSHRFLPDSYALHGLIYAEECLSRCMFPDDEDAKDLEMNSAWDTEHSQHCLTRPLGLQETDSG